MPAHERICRLSRSSPLLTGWAAARVNRHSGPLSESNAGAQSARRSRALPRAARGLAGEAALRGIELAERRCPETRPKDATEGAARPR
jgi:hypothetical protein